MGQRRYFPEEQRCDAITLKGSRCKNIGAFLSMGGQWCGQHHHGTSHAPYEIAPWAIGTVRYSAQLTPEHLHGTLSGYTNHGCRCDTCRAASTQYRARRRAEAATEPIWDGVHGTLNGYQNYSCRCNACTSAAVEYNRRRVS